MYVEVSTKRPVARRDEACALPRLAAWARRATQYRCATGRFRRVGRQRRGAGAAPLAANASHLKVHNTL
ncbi:hypothetical protein F7R02_12470 [Xanthomonas cissicola]|nr:hypothetical protein F7R02_12470 [Xanthomonas cissicola]